MTKLLYISRMATLMTVFYAAYYLLLRDNCMHTSIAAIISQSHQLENMKHILVLGLLPIYIGTIIFGSAVLGLYLSSKLQTLLISLQRNKFSRNKKQSIETFAVFSVRK